MSVAGRAEATTLPDASVDLVTAAQAFHWFNLEGADSVEKFDALLGVGRWTRLAVPNEQRLDREGLVGRLLSSSYSPRHGEPGHEETFAELRALFDRHAESAEVAMLYTTVIIAGHPA